jgi:S-adenosylmethionine decarboxylase proenzyme
MIPLAKHTLLEMRNCDPTLLRDRAALAPLLLAAVRDAGATIVTHVFHNFSPHGVSGVIVIAESHVAIHTWPEHEFAAVDIFSCSETLDHAAIAQAVQVALRASRVDVRTLERGL